ncbi:MAG: DDE-type integrase/transposase/recombinase [Hyphomonadaceae bacterium]|nr:DDE-type integrase/transposase/recombinase [Hyphomonadaceae bacterium]
MVSTIGGERVWTWRAIHHEGEVMDMVVLKRRDTRAALRLLRRVAQSACRT